MKVDQPFEATHQLGNLCMFLKLCVAWVHLPHDTKFQVDIVIYHTKPQSMILNG